MALAYKLLNQKGNSTKGGNKTWPLPNAIGPGKWMSTIHGIGEYYLCKRDNICLWIDCQLFIAEFSDIIKEDHGDLTVPDARLVMKINSWNNNTQNDFMQKIIEHIMPGNDSITPDEEQYVDQLKKAYAAKNLMGVSRFATHLAINRTEEISRQNNLIWEYIQEEIVNNFPEDAFA